MVAVGLSISITLTVWIYLLAIRLTGRHRPVAARLEAFTDKGGKARMTVNAQEQKEWVKKTARGLSARFLRSYSQKRLETLQFKLAQAGSPGDFGVSEWIGVRFGLTIFGALVGLASMFLTQQALGGLALLVGCTLLGFIGPDVWLSRRANQRSQEMLRAFPNTLDLLTVSVEAGLGFDQALSRIAQKMKGPLAAEMDRALREMQLGSQRAEALARLSKRTGVPAIQSFVSAVIQAEKLGIGLAQVLRVQSAEARRKRRMDAEERAMKAPIKMLFPLVLFVFPALFIIILGPAIIHIIQFFSHS